MELTILGTAAAEGWPAPFCRCKPCEEARRRGGPNIRTRSGALIDDDVKIDFGPDTVMQMQRVGRCLDTVRTIIFTHQHSDHIIPLEMQWASKPYTNTPPAQPIHIYGNAQVIELLTNELKPNLERYNFIGHTMEPHGEVITVIGDRILPLPADHCRGALVLRIQRARDGKTVFYGHDSGLYPVETLDALTEKGPVDIGLLDCTLGGQESQNRGHMGVDGVVAMVTELCGRGVFTDKTRIIATHFSHNGAMMYEDLVEYFLPHGIQVAFDGIVIDV